MDIEEVNQVLEELKKTRPEKLNAEAKRLFEAIMKIADERDVALSELDKKDRIINEMLKVIIDSSICDYFIKQNCKHYAGENKKLCDECLLDYFTKKVEG